MYRVLDYSTTREYSTYFWLLVTRLFSDERVSAILATRLITREYSASSDIFTLFLKFREHLQEQVHLTT